MKTSLENLRQSIREIAQNDARFNTPAQPGMACSPWVEDIIVPATSADKWQAIITAASGKTFQVDFTVDDTGKAQLGADAVEVVRKVDYARAMRPAAAKAGVSVLLLRAASQGGSDYLNADGTFKGGFDGCVLHMTDKEGYDAETAKKICGKIAQKTAASQAADPVNPPLRCRAAVDLPAATQDIPQRVMFLPAGQHTINCCFGQGSANITVLVDENTADVLNASLAQVNAANAPQRAFFDKNHEGKEATGWPTGFVWQDQPQPGVYAMADWSSLGQELIRGKVMRAFSPAFYTDAALPKNPRAGQKIAIAAGKRGSPENPARIVGLGYPDAGTLTNDPAFTKILPLWAKNAGASSGTVIKH